MRIKDNNKEIWVSVNGFENRYRISDQGRVYSILNQRILKTSTSKNGYKSMHLNGKTIYIHHLVAEHFLENPDNKNEINHKDCNPSNNCVDNLEWVTHKENCNYKDHGDNISAALKEWNKVHEHSKPMLGKKHSEATRKRISEIQIKKRDVICISTDLNLISSYESIWEASKDTGIPTCSIRNACCRRFKLCRGNIWRYRDDCEYKITV